MSQGARPVKVAVNTLFLIPGEVGGSETYLIQTLRALVAGHPDLRFALVTNRENDARLRSYFGGIDRVSFHPLPLRASNRYARILWEQAALPRLLSRIQPDLLWSPGYTMPAWAPCRQVVTIHDLQYRTHPEDLKTLARWTTHALISLAVRRADHIIAVSEFSKEEIVRQAGAPRDAISVTQEGVDPIFSSPMPSPFLLETRRKILNHDRPFLLSVSNSYPHKNLDFLVRAFRRISSSVPHDLVILGKERLGEPALKREIDASPAGRIHRVRSVSREELVALYQSCSAFVFPSLYEGFGLPLLEAMAAGAICLATGEGATREVGGDAIEYANGRDEDEWARAIFRLVHLSEEEKRERRDAARRRATLFTWEETARATRSAFEAALGY